MRKAASSGLRALEADHVVSMDIAGPVAVQTRKSIARHLANRAKKVSGARLSY
jgi:hypothetical protein